MSDLDRSVAGIRCREVLAALSDYLDGEVTRDVAERIEAHLAGCDVCERFGHRMGALVGALGAPLADEPPAELIRRIKSRIREG